MKRRSVARALSAKIADSPFNAVKLELGLVLLGLLALLLLLAGLDTPRALDALILALAAVAGALWVVWRSRRVLERQRSAREGGDGAQ